VSLAIFLDVSAIFLEVSVIFLEVSAIFAESILAESALAESAALEPDFPLQAAKENAITNAKAPNLNEFFMLIF